MTRKSSKGKKDTNRVILKSYSKVVLFYPLLVYSIIAVIVQSIASQAHQSLAILWMFIFFVNLIIIGFDFPSIKFFILFLVLVLAIVILILLDMNGKIDLSAIWDSLQIFFSYTLDTKFYGWATFVLAFSIAGAVLQAQLHFVKIERNEIYVRGLATGKNERFPTLNLQMNTEITDVFELMSLGAGKVTLKIGQEHVIALDMVPMVRKKKRTIDRLLSTTLVTEK